VLKLSPDACGRETPARPARKSPFALFFEIPTAEIFWKLKRDFSGGVSEVR